MGGGNSKEISLKFSRLSDPGELEKVLQVGPKYWDFLHQDPIDLVDLFDLLLFRDALSIVSANPKITAILLNHLVDRSVTCFNMGSSSSQTDIDQTLTCCRLIARLLPPIFAAADPVTVHNILFENFPFLPPSSPSSLPEAASSESSQSLQLPSEGNLDGVVQVPSEKALEKESGNADVLDGEGQQPGI